jgi:hypothetical protein
MPRPPARRRWAVVIVVVAFLLLEWFNGWNPATRIRHDIENLGNGLMIADGVEAARREVNGEILAVVQGTADGQPSEMLLAEGGIFPVSWGMTVAALPISAPIRLDELRPEGDVAAATLLTTTAVRPGLLPSGDYRSYLYGTIDDPRVTTLRATTVSGDVATFAVGRPAYVTSVNVPTDAGLAAVDFLDASGAVLLRFAVP